MKSKSTSVSRIIFFLLSFSFSTLLRSQIAGNWQYATQAGGSGADVGKGIAVDASGNTYVTGYFNTTATFIGTPTVALTSAGNNDIFLAKFDASGNVLWAVKAGGKLADISNSINIDASGNSYITGVFTDTATFYGSSNVQLISNGGLDIFIAKYDPTGNVLWAKKAGGYGSEVAFKIKADVLGNSYITGLFPNDTLVFYGTPNDSLHSNGGNDMFLAKFDPSGNVVWAKHSGGTGNDGANALDLDASGNIFVTGSFLNTDTFYTASSTIYFTSNGSNDIFVAKFDPLGNAIWAKQAGSSLTDIGNNIVVDNLSNCYLTGTLNSGCTFYGAPNIVLSSNGLSDVFLAKYDSLGNLHWAKHAGGTASEFCNGISLDRNMYCYLTGSFQNTATFYGATNVALTSAGVGDLFVALYDTSGNILCAQSGGSTTADRGWDVANNGLGFCYVAGEFTGTATFTSSPSFTLTATGTDIFMGEWAGCTGFTNIHSNNVEFSVYPNPASNIINISYPGTYEKLSIEILDIAGRIVFKQTAFLNNGQTQLQTNLTTGVYLINLKTENNKIISKKLIVTN
jgi:hypothetical protein